MKTRIPFETPPTQLELAESARRKCARHDQAILAIAESGNAPTLAELAQLRAKRPRLWNRYPETYCADHKPT